MALLTLAMQFVQRAVVPFSSTEKPSNNQHDVVQAISLMRSSFLVIPSSLHDYHRLRFIIDIKTVNDLLEEKSIR